MEVRLPRRDARMSPGRMRVWLKKAGIPIPVYKTWSGLSPAQWIKYNPTWSLRHWAELVLEHKDQILEKTSEEAAA